MLMINWCEKVQNPNCFAEMEEKKDPAGEHPQHPHQHPVGRGEQDQHQHQHQYQNQHHPQHFIGIQRADVRK